MFRFTFLTQNKTVLNDEIAPATTFCIKHCCKMSNNVMSELNCFIFERFMVMITSGVVVLFLVVFWFPRKILG
jgi:hypothetical protein